MGYSVSLVVIARDEARAIRRCLGSVRPFVDQMVVLDTGSRDDTRVRAWIAGARVHSYAWAEDFSAARNHALALADADWHVVLDADEWLTDGAEELAALRSTPPARIGVIDQVNSLANGEAVTRLPRILPSGVTYRGRVHEQPVPALPTWHSGVRVGHDGYLRAQLDRKGDRNRRLLEAELAEHPEDAYLRYQLGKDHEVARRYAQAAREYDAAWPVTAPDAPWRHDLLCRYLFTLAQAGRSRDALDLADAELPRWNTSADFCFVLGDVLLTHATAHPEQAAGLLPLVETMWQRCLELGDGDLPGSVRGRGSHLAAHNLALLRGEIGELSTTGR